MRLTALICMFQVRLVVSQFSVFDFGDTGSFLLRSGSHDKKEKKGSGPKGLNTGKPPRGSLLLQLFRFDSLENDVTPHNNDTNTTSTDEGPGDGPYRPGLVSLFHEPTTTEPSRHKKKITKQSQSSFDAPVFDSGLASMLSLINNTNANRKKGRKDDGSDSKRSKSSKGEKSSKGSKKSKKENYEKGKRMYSNGYPSVSPAPNGIAFDAPASGPALAPLIQGSWPSTSSPAAPSGGGATVPVARPTPPTLPVPVPTLRPVAAPVIPPQPAPTFVPTSSPVEPAVPTNVRSCNPTVGACVDSIADLEAAMDASDGGDTIAVCAGSDPFVTNAAVAMRTSDMKVCCLGASTTRGCVFRSAGTDSNFDLIGSSLRLQDLTFENGVSDTVFGGNVAIDGDGDHGTLLWCQGSGSNMSLSLVIDNCEFRNGAATQFGGNLFVQTTGTLSIVDSTFSGGRAGNSGGGLYVLNARAVNMTDTVFENNTVSAQDSTGGGMFSVLEDPNATYSQSIEMRSTRFEDNTADLGGGFFFTQLGSLPDVLILQTTFTDNTARQAGAAGAIADSLDRLTFSMQFSISNGNQAGLCDEILGFYDNSTSAECFDVGVNYPPTTP